jgi:hypothetical protein
MSAALGVIEGLADHEAMKHGQSGVGCTALPRHLNFSSSVRSTGIAHRRQVEPALGHLPHAI